MGGNYYEKLKVVGIYLGVVLMLGFMGPSFDGLTAEQSQEQKAERKAEKKADQKALQKDWKNPWGCRFSREMSGKKCRTTPRWLLFGVLGMWCPLNSI